MNSKNDLKKFQLLRSSLVNNFTQAVVCDDLGMTSYIIHSDARLVDKDTMKHKEKADLLEGNCRHFTSECSRAPANPSL